MQVCLARSQYHRSVQSQRHDYKGGPSAAAAAEYNSTSTSHGSNSSSCSSKPFNFLNTATTVCAVCCTGLLLVPWLQQCASKCSCRFWVLTLQQVVVTPFSPPICQRNGAHRSQLGLSSALQHLQHEQKTQLTSTISPRHQE